VKHLDRLGWDATVLTVTPHAELCDASLVHDVPDSTCVIRTGWMDMGARLGGWLSAGRAGGGSGSRASMQDCLDSSRPGTRVSTGPDVARRSGLLGWLSRLLATPDSRIGWIPPAVRAGLAEIRRRRPDVVYSTSPYMSAHLIALVLSRAARLPWVADFRDPWQCNPYRELGFRSLERWDSWLEWLVLHSATHIVCCTPTMTTLLQRRYPRLASRITTILNAFDRARFDRVEAVPSAPLGHYVLTHAGQFYGPRRPDIWFAALRRAIEETPSLGPTLRLSLIGSDHFEGRSLRGMAAEAGVAANVLTLGPLAHGETLARLAGSDALILAGSSGPGATLQIPNKLFEYLAVGRPILAACPTESPIVAVLRQARADALICPTTSERPLARAITRLATGRHRGRADAWTGVEYFERSCRAEELAGLFRHVSRRRSPSGVRVLKSASMPVRISGSEPWMRDHADALASDDLSA
jgi:glycosyltransferase involved in cell wall biosynthesis